MANLDLARAQSRILLFQNQTKDNTMFPLRHGSMKSLCPVLVDNSRQHPIRAFSPGHLRSEEIRCVFPSSNFAFDSGPPLVVNGME